MFSPQKFMYNYNFCVHNDKYQPSGSLNFSRIDNSNLLLKFNMDTDENPDNEIDIKIFAINYNLPIKMEWEVSYLKINVFEFYKHHNFQLMFLNHLIM